jgi:hypothetical protein
MIMSALPVALIKSRQPGSRPCATFLGNLGNVRSAFLLAGISRGRTGGDA